MLTTDQLIDRRILLEAESLRSAGWTVTIIAPDAAPDAADAAPSQPRAVPLPHMLARAGYRFLRDKVPWGDRLTRKAREYGWRFLMDQETFFRNLFAQSVAGLRPTVFIAHDLPTLPAAHQAARNAGAKLLYDSHELYAEQELSATEKARWTVIEQRYISECDAVVTVNRSIASELASRYRLDEVFVVQNAEKSHDRPARRNYFHEAFGLGPEAKILLMQGGLSAGRNIETLVQAMARVTNPNVHLVVLGDGPIRPRLARLIGEAGLADRVHLHDRVPQEELLSYTAAADAGVIPYQATSLNNFYCTPNKLFEFIAAGIAVLASDLPEIRRIVEGWEIGTLAPLAEAAATARSIDDFFGDEHRLAAWRDNARSARKSVCWEVEGAKFVEILQRLQQSPARESSMPEPARG